MFPSLNLPTLQLFNLPGDAVIGHCSPHSSRTQTPLLCTCCPCPCAYCPRARCPRLRYPHPRSRSLPAPLCSLPTALALTAHRPHAGCPPPAAPLFAARRPCAHCLLPSGFAAHHLRSHYPHRRARWLPPLRSLLAAPGVCSPLPLCSLPAALVLAARCPCARCLLPSRSMPAPRAHYLPPAPPFVTTIPDTYALDGRLPRA
jgi:hypothetical protein